MRRELAGIACTAVLIGGLVLTTGCGNLLDDQPLPGGQAAQAERPTSAQVAAAGAQLGGLSLAAWGSMAGYKRDLFPHWRAQTGGCDTREVVLKRDGTGVHTDGDCTVTAGSWFSSYDGKTMTDPHDLDIDHMVPLANAWRTGAATWTTEQREDFANDLDRPQLLAVSAATNRAKGDQDPSQWRPPLTAYWCEYAVDWITVKSYWRLTVTTAEHDALAEMLARCG